MHSQPDGDQGKAQSIEYKSVLCICNQEQMSQLYGEGAYGRPFGKGAARKEWGDVDIARLYAAGSEETACNIDFPKLIGNCRKRLPELTFDIFMAKRMDRMSYDEISKAFHGFQSKNQR